MMKMSTREKSLVFEVESLISLVPNWRKHCASGNRNFSISKIDAYFIGYNPKSTVLAQLIQSVAASKCLPNLLFDNVCRRYCAYIVHRNTTFIIKWMIWLRLRRQPIFEAHSTIAATEPKKITYTTIYTNANIKGNTNNNNSQRQWRHQWQQQQPPTETETSISLTALQVEAKINK